ncbi:MAG: M28 family metallopeptidase [Terriglobia bacterium]|nr:M28 family metallopeptidase [Terriglobia bacterium]
MSRVVVVAVIAVLSLPLLTGQSKNEARLMGFSAEGSEHELSIESQLNALVSAESARTFHRYFTSEPHPAGTEQDHKVAEYIADTWRKQGIEDVTIRQYDVLSMLPREIAVDMVSPVVYRAGLREDAYPQDPDTSNPAVRGAWLSMSASGEVTAPIVYAHSGNPEDYEVLKKAGIDVRGKIVLVRYSNPYSYRGFKALTAQRMGAAAILIYSDPEEDGYKKGKVYPDGPWGPESHFQRGSITYDFIVPGDPLTPGWASVPGAKRIPMKGARSLPGIMAVPLSWKDAKPLLVNMGGPKAPKSWRGGLPITYRLGGQAKVHVKVDMDTRTMPYYNVEGRIRGAKNPDQMIVLGNHHDAWEFGAVDPSSGTASLMELTRVLGTLLQKGIRPDRTLVFCSWDGEEVGLTGSTEWGEQFEDNLKKNAVAYINVDSSTSGPDFDGSAVGSLAPMLLEATRSFQDPATGKSLYEAWKSYVERTRKTEKDKQPVTDANMVNVRIGSGSDHTVFLNHDGVPVIGLQFDGPYGVYHSVYDDFFWMNHFGDPGYRYHALMSKLWGAVALRLANADTLPFDFSAYAGDLRDFVQEVTKKPGAKEHLQFADLMQKIDEFEAAGKSLKEVGGQSGLSPDEVKQINAAIMEVERNWLNPDGIPGRPWFKHELYAARYTYAHLELPGITEAVEAADWKTAQQQIDILKAATAKNAELLAGVVKTTKTSEEVGGRK